MTGLYFLGIIMGIVTALVYRKTLFKGEAVPFVMELPNYRMPGMKNVVQLLWEKAKDFLQRAFTVILLATMCIWFLQSFDLHFNLVTESKNSTLPDFQRISADLCATGTGGLADMHFPYQWIYGKGKCCIIAADSFRRCGGCRDLPCSGSVSSGVQPALYALCGSDCFHTERVGPQMGTGSRSLSMWSSLDHGTSHKRNCFFIL